MMRRAPENSAAAPTPEMGLQTMKVTEFGATAEIRDST
jgi:hypothetical protein